MTKEQFDNILSIGEEVNGLLNNGSEKSDEALKKLENAVFRTEFSPDGPCGIIKQSDGSREMAIITSDKNVAIAFFAESYKKMVHPMGEVSLEVFDKTEDGIKKAVEKISSFSLENFENRKKSLETEIDELEKKYNRLKLDSKLEEATAVYEKMDEAEYVYEGLRYEWVTPYMSEEKLNNIYSLCRAFIDFKSNLIYYI